MKLTLPKIGIPKLFKGKKGCIFLLGGGAILSIILIVVAVIFLRGDEEEEPLQTTAVERGNITVTLSGSGSVAAEKSLDVSFKAGGTVESVLATEGDEVDQDDVLAQIEKQELELGLADAEANLESTLAKLEQTQKGNATEQDIQSAQANVEQAEIQLDQQINGNATNSDIASAQASLRSAQAQLEQQVVSNNANIANAESRLRVAEAKLADLEDGSDPEELSSAQRSYDQALVNYNNAVSSLEETRDKLSREKTQAQTSMQKATQNLQIIQSDYSVAYWRKYGVDKDDIIPTTTESRVATEPESLTAYGELTEEEAFKQAELQLKNAEADIETAKNNYEQALNSEKTGVFQAEQNVASAEAQLRDAEIQLQDVQAGADEIDLIQAREEVAQARIELQELASSANSDIVQRQSSVEQSAAQLMSLQTGGTEHDIASSQASLQQAMSQLEKLTAPATDSDLSIQQAAVQQAQNNVERARIDLENSELLAPFAGIITSVDIIEGSVVGESSVAFNLIDRDPLHVDVTLNENDITLIEAGQEVLLTISALSDWQATGTVTYVSPVAEESTDVVTYRVRVSFPDSDARVKVGMTADLEIVTKSVNDVLTVPNTALTTRGEKQIVMVMDPQSQTPRPAKVETGISDGTNTEIISGLEEEEQIVANVALLEGGSGTSSNRSRGMFPLGGPPPSGGGNRDGGGGQR